MYYDSIISCYIIPVTNLYLITPYISGNLKQYGRSLFKITSSFSTKVVLLLVARGIVHLQGTKPGLTTIYSKVRAKYEKI